MTRKKKQKLELQIETIAKKMNIFSLNDIEVLLEKNKVEIKAINYKIKLYTLSIIPGESDSIGLGGT